MKRSGSRRNKVYCIFYLDKKNFGNIKSQLEEAGINDVKAIIPMVNVLKKTRNGKMVYSEEPVLFNYGFMKMDIKKAHNRMFLNKLKKTIPGIHHWVKDTITVHPRKKKARVDNAEDFDDFSLVAICPRKDVRRFIKIAKENKKYSLDDLVNIKIGQFVHLKGYPYEGVEATVTSVDLKNRIVGLEMIVNYGTMKLSLPFDNVLYSVYQNYDPDVLYASYLDKKEEDITQEKIDNILNKRTY
jgi:hypothetical protein